MRIFFILAAHILLASLSVHAGEITVPQGYELQVLDTTKGEIARPIGWFYDHFADSKSLVWTISKEDSSKGSYITGMRIQFTPSIDRFTKKLPSEIVQGLIAAKQKSVKVDKLCNVETVGEFQKICLETTEPTEINGKNFKILYTYSWSNTKQSIAITTFGAPEEDWVGLKDTIKTMSEIVLIGKDFWYKK
jgi:hypothetical protein